ncbi:GatA Asp-tRNAAsn/Glu-tRNAGln amidotransferase A subunit and related amidases [Candidatus Nanopelagicaceae bacterium]
MGEKVGKGFHMKSVAAVEESLSKISEIDQSGYTLNSVLATAPDALEQAEAYDRKGSALPLQGLPILIKDNIEAFGLPASAGSLALADTPVTKDSTIARRLREAGAVIIGATNLSEWANIRSTKSTSGWSAVGGLTANPWKHGRSAGGSSSGSGAAVAAGLTQWAIGSETDGSIICPASLNGCVGIKPTVGSIPRDGMVPISTNQDSPGPMAQTVEQAAILLDVLTGKSEFAKAVASDQKIKIGVVRQWLTSNNELNTLFDGSVKVLEKRGFTLVDVELTEPAEQDHEDELRVLLYELSEGLGTYLSHRSGSRLASLREVVQFNIENSGAELKHFGQELFDMALDFESQRDEYLASRARNKLWAEKTLVHGLKDVDILIGCTFGPAWESNLETGDNFQEASWICTAPSIAGAPIGTIPMGLVSGMPVGLGFVSARNQEATLISAMSNAERALGLGVLKPTFTR